MVLTEVHTLFLRTLEPSVPTINYELRLVLEKEIVQIKLKIEIIICKPANMRYVLMLKKNNYCIIWNIPNIGMW